MRSEGVAPCLFRSPKMSAAVSGSRCGRCFACGSGCRRTSPASRSGAVRPVRGRQAAAGRAPLRFCGSPIRAGSGTWAACAPGRIVVHEKAHSRSVGVRFFTDLRCFELLRYDRFAGANACARTAVDALVGVDNVDVAGRNSLDGALADAGAASHAGVRDFVSHVCKIFVLVCCVFCAANIRKLFDDVKSGIRN